MLTLADELEIEALGMEKLRKIAQYFSANHVLFVQLTEHQRDLADCRLRYQPTTDNDPAYNGTVAASRPSR